MLGEESRPSRNREQETDTVHIRQTDANSWLARRTWKQCKHGSHEQKAESYVKSCRETGQKEAASRSLQLLKTCGDLLAEDGAV
jgi:hypothetical protein